MNRKHALLIPALLLTLLVRIDECLSQQISIFGNAVPAGDPAIVSQQEITLGVKFWSSQSGTISAIRFYRWASSPFGYVARLYSADGSALLGSMALATESGPVPGWQTAAFPTSLPISANTTYVATYYAPTGQFAYTNSGLANGVANPPLTAPAESAVGGNGIYNNGLAFPTLTYEATNYFVDVFFTPAAGQTPVLSLSFDPPNPSISSTAPLGTTVATIVATWSDGQPFTGTLWFGPPNFDAGGRFSISGNSLIINPTGIGVNADVGLAKQITIVATP